MGGSGAVVVSFALRPLFRKHKGAMLHLMFGLYQLVYSIITLHETLLVDF